MIKIAIANQKGGVGKTTTALNIADALIHCNYKVLFLDLDPQCNSTSSYNAKIEKTTTIYDVINGECLPSDAIQHTDFGDIIAGDRLLTECEGKLLTNIGGHNVIKKALHQIEETCDYDFVIMDTPPNLGIYMLNALTAANGCIIPLKAEKYAVDGLKLLIETINDVIENTNAKLRIYGVLLTAYDKRTSLDKAIWKTLPNVGKVYGFNVFKTPVRICQTIKDAQAEGISLFKKDSSSNGSLDYAHIVKELLENLEED